MIFTITTVAAGQYQNYPTTKPIKSLSNQQQPPNPYLHQQSFALAPGDISAYLPLIQKYVPGASLTPPELQNPSATSYLPQNQQLPKLEAPAQPFYSPLPSTALRAPQTFAAPTNNYYEVPVPSQELQVPTQFQWNPDNDPRFYFDSPSVVPVKEEVPTNLYPKKYDKEIHATAKPYLKVKEDSLPANNGQYDSYSQKKLNKPKQNLRKQEKPKRPQSEKVQKQKKIKPSSGNSQSLVKNEPQTAETGYLSGFDSDGGDHHSSHFNSDLKAALHSEHHSPKERLEFQMHGHDGPDSYKWGFDHGEG